MKTIIKLLVILALGAMMTSCSSGWSCKNRYVNRSIKVDETYIQMHRDSIDAFDRYVLTKYKTKS